LALCAASAGLYTFVLRRPILTWGATNSEAAARLPGDELLDPADGVSTRAIEISAPAQVGNTDDTRPIAMEVNDNDPVPNAAATPQAMRMSSPVGSGGITVRFSTEIRTGRAHSMPTLPSV
jgi:hypothetical protein